MPDREKVIKGLETMREFFGFGLQSQAPVFEAYQNILTDALALLKEQEAVEPKVIGENSFGHPVHACGKCGLLITESMNYCHECGKRIKWEGR